MSNKDRQPLVTFTMFLILVIMLVSCISGCSTVVPVTAKFPEAPATAMEQCTELQEVAEDAKLSDLAKVVTDNYRSYYECAVKVETWQEWYQKQKAIFDGVSK